MTRLKAFFPASCPTASRVVNSSASYGQSSTHFGWSSPAQKSQANTRFESQSSLRAPKLQASMHQPQPLHLSFSILTDPSSSTVTASRGQAFTQRGSVSYTHLRAHETRH